MNSVQDIARLGALKEGQTARVKDILQEGTMRRRLQDIGIIEGTRIKCLQKSFWGDPVAYLIRGAVISLREEDSDQILVETVGLHRGTEGLKS